jgi:hypothetical protein
MCRDAPRPDTSCTPRSAGLVKGVALYLRGGSGATRRPARSFTGGASMASTHPLTRPSTVVPHQSSGTFTPRDFASRAASKLWERRGVNSSFPLASHIPHNAGLARTAAAQAPGNSRA